MAQYKWLDALRDFEPDAFPDLTGLSAAAKLTSGHDRVTNELNVSLGEMTDWCKTRGYSITELLQVAWVKVLACYLGETDISFGFSSCAGECVPVRVTFHTPATNEDLLKEVHRYWKESVGPEKVRRDQIVAVLGPVVDRLLDTGLSFEKSREQSSVSCLHGISSLSLELVENDVALWATLHFSYSVLLKDDAPFVFVAFEEALRSIMFNVSSPFLSWNTSSSGLRKSISNGDCVASPTIIADTIHGLVEHFSDNQPQGAAIDFLHINGERTMWTYHELNYKADLIANHIIAKTNVKLEDPIPICVPKSPEFYACILAVMKSGACFTPFSGSPVERKQFMLNELGAKVVLYTADEDMSWCKCAARLNVSEILASAARSTSQVREFQERPCVSGGNLAYQMYTSGSTGRPKAVSLEHRHTMQTVMASRNMVPWKIGSRMLQYAAPSFDMCYYDTFLAWSLGICLCSASDAATYDYLTRVVNTLNVDLLGLTPSVALTLNPPELPTVEWMYCIGEAMPQSLVDSWGKRLVNSYGPTEAAQMVTLFQADPKIKASVIGFPFPNTAFYILQKGTNVIAPVLAVGELCIGGFQVARGYHANEEKTNSSFVNFNGKRLYRTGDLARMLGNGTFEFVGRNDDQVKIRGQRVELGEINQHILEQGSSARQATTQILKVNDQAKGQLVSFIVFQEGFSALNQAKACQEIETRLSTSLPTYMVPKILIPVDQIPLSASGKVDRKVLTSILQKTNNITSNTTDEEREQCEWSELAMIMRKVFASVSGVSPQSITHQVSIFQLGIDSLGAIRVATLLRRKGLDLHASDIMASPSISQLERLASLKDIQHQEQQQQTFDFRSFHRTYIQKAAAQSHLPDSSIQMVRPCSALQSGMIAQTIHVDEPLYFNHLTYNLLGNEESSNFEAAWTSVIEKHEILRSGFLHTDDSQFPFAMITYKKGIIDYPLFISTFNDDVTELSNMRKRLIMQPQIPPWKVFINNNTMELFIHHALYDAQVLELIINDLVASLRGERLDDAVPIERQLSILLDPIVNQEHDSSEFWKSMESIVVPTRFPTLTPLKIDNSGLVHVSRKCFKTLAELEHGCRSNDITLQVAGQASWGRLLLSYTGEDKVTFGTVLSGRTIESSNEVGYPCITTIPVLFRAQRDKKVMLQDLMKYNADAQKHQFVPLKRIEKLTGHINEALFDSIFTLQKRRKFVDEESTIIFSKNKLSIDYPVSIELEPGQEGELLLNLYFRPSRIPREQAIIILQQLDSLLCDIVSEACDSSLPSAGDASAELYSKVPARENSLPSTASLLHEMFEESAVHSLNRVALEHVIDIPEGKGPICKRTWTYSEVEEAGNKVSNLILKSGICTGSVVAICFEKCPEAAFAMLGIMKAGCSFLALDPGAPLDRKRFIIQDSNACALITQGEVVEDLLSSLNINVLRLDRVVLDEFASSRPILNRVITPDDLSYCLYTSGTTGLPKGCAITHENVVQAMLSFQRLYKWDNASRWLQFASYHFDVSVMEHFWSWSVGMCVVTASRDLVFTDLSGIIRRLSISHIDLTPSLARILEPSDVPCLAKGVFVVGGEMLRQDILDKWGPTGAIHNAYGPTEATIGVTMYPGVPSNGRSANIGKQFDNVGSFIVEPQDYNRLVLRGGVGELCVSGKLVARGYINRPELTSRNFVNINGERAYRTGDLVRMLHDESFEFVGRIDDQIKLRGQRLEIGEINSVAKHSNVSIKDIATLVLKHPMQQKEQLVSFVVVQMSQNERRGSIEISYEPQLMRQLQEARAACEAKLPPYMVPTHFIAINRMPLSANNKTDTKQLRRFYDDLTLEDLQRLAVKGDCREVEAASLHGDDKKIVEAVAATLDISQELVAYNTSFFQLGLDSISVITLSKALRSRGIEISTPSIMRNPSVARLSHAVSAFKINENSDLFHGIVAARQYVKAFQHRCRLQVMAQLGLSLADIEAFAPCTPLQQGIVSRALESSGALYFNSFRLSGIGNGDIPRLKKSFHVLLENTQVFRTAFVPTDEGFAQLVFRQKELIWNTKKASQSNGQDSAEIYFEEQHSFWRKQTDDGRVTEPFVVFVHEGSEESDISLGLFHGCYDGRSLSRVFECIFASFHGLSYTDYGPKFHEILPHGPLQDMSNSASFWKKFLKSAPCESEKYSLLKSGDMTSQEFSSTRLITLFGDLDTCRRNLDVTHQAIFQTCWIAALQDCFQSPLLIGIILSGTSIDCEDVEKVIGPIFNTVPFLLGLQDDDYWVDAIRRCHDLNTQILPHQHTPLRDIQKWVKGYTSSASNQLFESVFVYQMAQTSLPSIEAPWRETSENVRPDFPLAFEVEQLDNSNLRLTLVAQQGLSHANTFEKLMENFEICVRSVMENTHGQITDQIAVYPLPKVKSMPNESEELPDHIELNGVPPKCCTEDDEPFQWSELSMDIRYEVSRLANVPATDISPDTSILELGLDSIDAVKLSSRLRNQMGMGIPVSRLMRALTIRKIEALLSDERTKSHAINPAAHVDAQKKRLREYYIDFESSHFDDIIPATPLQEAMIAEMMESNYTRYFNHDILELAADIDFALLERAWTSVVESTPILRSQLLTISDPEIDATFAFAQSRENSNIWQQIDVENDMADVLENIRLEFVGRSRPDKLLQLTLVQKPRNETSYLILSISHALYDGWSIWLIHDAVKSIYHQPGNTSELRQPPIEPVLSNIMQNPDEKSLFFWTQALQDISPSTIPLSRDLQVTGKVYRSEAVSEIPVSSVQRFCKGMKVTAAAFSQAIWSLALASLLKRLDVVFGLVLSGRDTEEAQSLRYPTMNTVLARSVIHGTYRQMLDYTQQNLNNLSKHQHFPLRTAVKMARNMTNGADPFNTLFIFQKRPSGTKDERNELYKSVEGASDVEYPLCIEAEVEDDKFTWRIASKGNYLTPGESDDLLGKLILLIQEMIEKPEAKALSFINPQTHNLEPELAKHAETSQDRGHDHFIDNGKSLSIDTNGELSVAEKSIRRAVSRVAGIDEKEVNKGSSLLSLGLDSISAIKVSSVLRKNDIRLTAGQIIRGETVSGIAAFVTSNEGATSATQCGHANPILRIDHLLENLDLGELLSESPISEDMIESLLPATSGQTFMLSKWQNSGLYNSPLHIKAAGIDDLQDIYVAWARLVSNIKILRTAFIATGNVSLPIVQVIMKTNAPSSSISQQSSDQKDVGIHLGVTQLTATHLENGVWDVCIELSHALYDGYSLHLLLQKFLSCFKSGVNKELGVSQEYLTYFNEAQKNKKDTESFWKLYLSGLNQKCVQAFPKTGLQNTHLVEPFAVPDISTLRAVARKVGVTVQSLFIATYAIVYASKFEAQGETDDILIGIYTAARSFEGADSLEMPTLGFVPLRIRGPLHTSVSDLATRIQHDLGEISEGFRSSVGLWELSRWLGKAITIDTWVNLLQGSGSKRLLNADDGQGPSILYEEKRERLVETKNVVNESRNIAPGLYLRKNKVKDMYKESVDIEATVYDDSIDIGIIASDTLISHNSVKGVFNQLKENLNSMATGAM